MKKLIFLLTTACACCYASPDVLGPQTFRVNVQDEGDTFTISARTLRDMPNAVSLEIASLHVTRPRGPAPGLISLVVCPQQADMWIEMVGPQIGVFPFQKGQFPEGKYRLDINGEMYGRLVIEEDSVHLHKPKH